jgi:hypothetical protein
LEVSGLDPTRTGCRRRYDGVVDDDALALIRRVVVLAEW